MSTFSYNQEALKNLHIEDTALLDRLAHHARILTTRGESFRTRRRKVNINL